MWEPTTGSLCSHPQILQADAMELNWLGIFAAGESGRKVAEINHVSVASVVKWS